MRAVPFAFVCFVSSIYGYRSSTRNILEQRGAKGQAHILPQHREIGSSGYKKLVTLLFVLRSAVPASTRRAHVKMFAPVRIPMSIQNGMLDVSNRLLGPESFINIGDGAEIRAVKGKGRGVFATRDIPKGVYLGRYTGRLMTEQESDSAIQRGETSGRYFMEFPMLDSEMRNESFIIDGEEEKKSSWTRFINHSKRKANCMAVPLFEDRFRFEIPLGIYIETTKKISAGEEILFDYGGEYWANQGFSLWNPQRYIIDYF